MFWTDRKMIKQVVHFFHKLLRYKGSSSGNAAGLGTDEWLEPDCKGRLKAAGTESEPATEHTGGKAFGGAVFEELAEDRKFEGTAVKEVASRKEFECIVNKSLRESQPSGCMLIADVDRFREINDIYGQDIGDAILWNVVSVLGCCLPAYECIGRQGGDTFAMWLPSTLPERVQMLRRQTGVVNDRLMHPFEELPPVSVSVGAAFGEPGDDCRSLNRKAVKALNRVKESGRCGFEIYEGKEAGRSAMED